MVELFNKLPGSTRTPASNERRVLRRLPRVLALGSLLLALPSLVTRFVLLLIPEWAGTTALSTVDSYAASLVIVLWMAVLTVAIAAFVVPALKGAAGVAGRRQ